MVFPKGYQKIVGALAVLLLLNCLYLSEALNSDPCKGVNCGQGQCVADVTAIGGFNCQCDQGWAKIVPILTFLSCFVPNCTLNFTCDAAPPPRPPAPVALPPAPSTDPFNFCLIPGICWSGNCVEVPPAGILQLPSYKCDCYPGNANLFNQTTGPCLAASPAMEVGIAGLIYDPCVRNLNASCPKLGLPLFGGPPSPPPGGTAPSPQPNEGFSPSPTPSAGFSPSPTPYAGTRQRCVARYITSAVLVISVMWLLL